MSGPQLYADNAAAMWASLAPWTRPVAGPPHVAATSVPAQAMIRVIITGPVRDDPGGRVAAILGDPPRGGRVVVEDSFGGLRLPADARVTVERLPVMVRPPGPPAPAPVPAGVTVERVGGGARLAAAERVIVEGFPKRPLLPYRPWRALPPSVTALPGWHVWLACAGGQPAAACCTYGDGRSAGLYWVATLPAHRSRGLGRLVVTAALAGAGDLPATLVATQAGVPLYESLGFRAVATALWHRRPAATPA